VPENTLQKNRREHLELGQHWSYNFLTDPKRLGFVLSRYKSSAKFCAQSRHVLELGCGIGIGATMLAENGRAYTGVDFDEPAIETARANLASERFRFIYDDFMGKRFGEFDAVVSLDVIEHIFPEFEEQYFETILMNLSPRGVCIIGTPNLTAAPYASHTSQLGHVNLYTQERLIKTLQKYFHQALPFGINDELLHTGYGAMCHYLLCAACLRKI